MAWNNIDSQIDYVVVQLVKELRTTDASVITCDASPVNVRLVTGQPPPVKMAWPTITGGGVRRGS